MKNKMYRRFKDDIRETFISYALIPIFVITLVGYIAAFTTWYHVISKENKQNNSAISKRVEEMFTVYQKATKNITQDERMGEFIIARRYGIEVHEWLYQIIHQLDLKGEFHIYDKNMNLITGSNENIPPYATRGNPFAWGPPRQMKEHPERVVIDINRSQSSRENQLTIVIGEAIRHKGQIVGYLTFDFYEANFLRYLNRNSTSQVVLTDKYNNIIVSTDLLLTAKIGKFDLQMGKKQGFVANKLEGLHYVSTAHVLEDKINIYVITYVGYIQMTFVILGCMLSLLLGILFLILKVAARKIAENKTIVIDQILQALGNVQNGQFDTELVITTQDEFYIIGERFNKMVEDIKNLMELSQEKARESIISEIKQLESQFNPHFLFNTLEIIRVMIKIDSTAANKMIVALSVLLRYSINNTLTDVTLQQDIEHTQNYLLLQKYRFGNKLDYHINVPKEAAECIVPKLITQPLIENAIVYGFANQEHILINVSARIRDENLIIVIFDDGKGIEPTKLEEIQTLLKQNKNTTKHIGLYNVHRRIKLMYGEAYGVVLDSQPTEGTVVKIILPVNRLVLNRD